MGEWFLPLNTVHANVQCINTVHAVSELCQCTSHPLVPLDAHLELDELNNHPTLIDFVCGVDQGTRGQCNGEPQRLAHS